MVRVITEISLDRRPMSKAVAIGRNMMGIEDLGRDLFDTFGRMHVCKVTHPFYGLFGHV